MRKILFSLFVISAALIVVTTATGAYFSDQDSIQGSNFSTSSSTPQDVVLNEFMANPTGADDALMPGGEWVELYNKGNWAIDLSGWYLTDVLATPHSLAITATNSSTGSTMIPAHGYLVVYRNHDGSFELNNSNDGVRLYNQISVLIDSYNYLDSITENKTWGRIPNGIGVWTSGLTPTPGGSNV